VRVRAATVRILGAVGVVLSDHRLRAQPVRRPGAHGRRSARAAGDYRV